MSSKFQAIPQFAGIRDMRTLLDFLDDRERYSKLVEDIEGRREQVNKLIEKVGAVQSIDSARREAARLMEDAKNEQQKVRKEGQLARDKIKARELAIETKVAEFDAAQRAWKSEMATRQSHADAQERAASKKMAEAEKKINEAQAHYERGQAAIVSAEARIAKLKEAMH